jgi:hypothetical protein
MTVIEYANVLQAFLVCILTVFVIRQVGEYRLDAYRQQMFALRDELFDFAADGNISFNDPAYRLLRDQMNATIRFGHNLTLYRLLMTWGATVLARRAMTSNRSEQLQKAIEALDDTTLRCTLRDFHDRAMYLQMHRLIMGSPLLFVAAAVVGLALLSSKGFTTLTELKKEAGSSIMRGPISLSTIEAESNCFAS